MWRKTHLVPFMLEISPDIHIGRYPGIADVLIEFCTGFVFFLKAF